MRRFSIITPSFNQGEFIEKTIDSVLSQGYKNYEYIIIDGGSDDNSVDIIKKYEKFLAFWVSEKDDGQTCAINRGLKIANGQIVSWINSDDYYAPDTLEIINEYDLICSKDVYYGDYTLVNRNEVAFLTKKEIPFKRDLLLHGVNFIGQPSSFFKKDLLCKYGYLDESLNFMMDYEFWLRVAFKNASFQHIPANLAFYRYHSSSKTVSSERSFHDEQKLIGKQYYRYDNTLYLFYKNITSRIARQLYKIFLRNTIDIYGGPLRWLAYKSLKSSGNAVI
jgi:glycosyltransferase involved in cell wall biosynthesis